MGTCMPHPLQSKPRKRSLSTYVQNLPRLAEHASHVARCVQMFRNPWSLLRAYIAGSSLHSGPIHLRDGLKLHLGKHPFDVVTAFLIFARETYGRIEPGSVVVDIGANIGLFSLWAARCGARSVWAFEPNSESSSLIRKNIEANDLHDVIMPKKLAVAGRGGSHVRFPKRSDVRNCLEYANDVPEDETEEVVTTDLAAIVAEVGSIDLLKIDCEGAEYEILKVASIETLSRVRHIKLEYHRGGDQELTDLLARHGFQRTMLDVHTERLGNMWFERVGAHAGSLERECHPHRA